MIRHLYRSFTSLVRRLVTSANSKPGRGPLIHRLYDAMTELFTSVVTNFIKKELDKKVK